jgi:hypothetical protein
VPTNATVTLRHGNLFDGPTDLIVLPCSTAGTITSFVARELANYDISPPPSHLLLGEIEITPFVGADNIAQYVAFAASVAGPSSRIEAIRAIARKLGEITRSNGSITRISVPLLGTGAGGLPASGVVEALKSGFLAEAAPGSSLYIYVLDRRVFDNLRIACAHAESPAAPLRVFISHTSNTADAIAWVEKFATTLTERGVQARLDRFHLRKGMDLAQWMCNELTLAQKVIVVCDEKYKEKADGRVGGVGWETMIIQGDLSRLPADSTKYQVIVRSAELDSGLPLYLRTRYAFHVPNSEINPSLLKELIQELLDLPAPAQSHERELIL